MPLCDWTKFNAGLYHHFHQRWIGDITDSLNAGRLPADLFALVGQFAGGLHPDALTLERGTNRDNTRGGIALLRYVAANPISDAGRDRRLCG